ncbi:MAG: DUF4845 domain-containing protein [Candidatus Polarisedimenticolaceae bacterium]|nr:DUF4845 domain-containing protein [Candidatus Polarisedimenticolaceae bacterium]
MNKSLYKQRGLSYTGWLMAIAIVAVIAVMAFRIVPVYMQHATVVTIIESLQDEPDIGRKSRAEIRALLGKRFNMNMITGVSSNDITITKKNHTMFVELNYQVKEPVVHNMEVLITFSDQIEMKP